MANISDVFFKIRYRKNGKFWNDDFLEDKDIFKFLSENSYPSGNDDTTIYCQNKEKLIFRTYGRWNYWNQFDFEDGTVSVNDFFQILESKQMENVYFLYIDYEEGMAMKGLGIIELDVKEKKIHKNGMYATDFPAMKINDFLLLYNKNVNIDDEDAEYEMMKKNMLEILYNEFLEFLEKSKFIFEMNDVLKIREEIIDFFDKYWKTFKYVGSVEILSNISLENENVVVKNEKISFEKESFLEKLKTIITKYLKK